MAKLSDDWGWGRSQKTGESGLIPFVIMEDVVRERERERERRGMEVNDFVCHIWHFVSFRVIKTVTLVSRGSMAQSPGRRPMNC